MYLAVNTQVIFPESRGRRAFSFNSVNSFRVESSWATLTDTAEVVIAKKIFFEDKGKVVDAIHVGDPIKIRGGYNGNYYDEFSGVISEIKDELPVRLKCEDNMYVLKRTPVHKVYSSVKLQKLLEDIIPPQFKVDAMDIEIGGIYAANKTVSLVLRDLKDALGIYSYFNGDTLISGKIYTDNPNTEVVKYGTSGNRKNIITSDLNYRKKEDIKIKVKIESTLSNGKKKTVIVGDDDGVEQKLVITNVSDIDSLNTLAWKEYHRLKVGGLFGYITTFGIPFVKHGYTASIENIDCPEHSGDYYVESVVTSLNDMGAYRRELKIGGKAAKQK